MRTSRERNSRRTVTVCAVLALGWTAARRVHASTEVEAAGYGGQEPSVWGCGPVMGARYAGVGTRVSAQQRDRELGRKDAEGEAEGAGLVADVGGAVERQAFELVDARCGSAGDLLSPRTSYAGVLRGGWDGSWYAVRAGGSLSSVSESVEAGRAGRSELLLRPEVELMLHARRIPLDVRAGFGTPSVIQLMRPGLYAGVAYAFTRGFALEARASAYLAAPGANAASRFDLAGRLALTRDLRLIVAVDGAPPVHGVTAFGGGIGAALRF
jgi:hypothetical protein